MNMICVHTMLHTHTPTQIPTYPVTAQSFPKRMLDPLQHPSFRPRTMPCNQPSLHRSLYLENRFRTDMSCQACCLSNQIFVQLNPPREWVQRKLSHFCLPSKISEYVVVHVDLAVEEIKSTSFLFGFRGHFLEDLQIPQAMLSNLPGFCSWNPKWSKIHLSEAKVNFHSSCCLTWGFEKIWQKKPTMVLTPKLQTTKAKSKFPTTCNL